MSRGLRLVLAFAMASCGSPAPWQLPHLIHMQKSLPGELDVMAASLLNTSRIGIGFNRDVAWTHRVSTALRFTVYELELDLEDPMRYRYDDD